MTPAVCGAQHPERELLCDKSVPCTGYHANAAGKAVWGLQEMPETAAPRRRRERGPGKAHIAMIVQRTQ